MGSKPSANEWGTEEQDQGQNLKRKQAPAALKQLGTEILLFLPVVFFLTYAFQERFLALNGLIPVQVVTLYAVCAFAGWIIAGRPGFWRSLVQIASMLGISAIMGWLLLSEPYAAGFLAFYGFLFSFRGRRLFYTNVHEYFQPLVAVVGLFGYFLLPLFVRFLPLLTADRAFLNAAGIVSLGIVFLQISRANLLYANQQREGGAWSSMLWKNRMWAFLLFGIAIVAGFITPISRVIREGARNVWEQLVHLYLWLLPDAPAELAPAPPAEPQQLPMLPESNPPHPFWAVFEKIVTYLALAALALALVYLLYLGGKKFPAALAKLKAWIARLFGGGSPEESTGYVDEKESLLELSETPRLLLTRVKDWFSRKLQRKESWSELTDNKEKMRFLYRLMLRQAEEGGYTAKPDMTPMEVGRELSGKTAGNVQAVKLTERYSAVRYGEVSPSIDEVNEIAQVIFEKRSRNTGKPNM
ncbi:DUF4129 domain-containing protein [Gorillibacterium timonense]|uniref:DUF4129 domain-containing protein n=1 Tax=Gorillibacterium timonense TaxID=1689269 RepID=UPI00071D5BD0|nr:DUF4129 domain-containing protein [Gorillibacterium timonense]